MSVLRALWLRPILGWSVGGMVFGAALFAGLYGGSERIGGRAWAERPSSRPVGDVVRPVQAHPVQRPVGNVVRPMQRPVGDVVRPVQTRPVGQHASQRGVGEVAGSEKEDFLTRYAKTFRFRMGKPSHFSFTQDGKQLLFLRSGPRSFVRNLYALDLVTGKERVLLTAETLLLGVRENLSAEEKARRERLRLAARGLVSYRIAPDGGSLLLPLSGKLYLYDLVGGRVRVLDSKAGYPIDARFSPDGKQIAVVREGDLYVVEIATGKERRLTTRTEGITHATAEFVAQEEMGRMRGYWWSPNSRQILYQQTDERGVEWIYLPNAAQPQSKPHKQRYPRPGKANAIVRLGLLDLASGKTRWIGWDRKNFPYLNTVRWSKGAPLTLLVQDRLQRHARLLAVDTATGALRMLLEERDAAWLNIDQSVPHWLPDGQSFLWSSERDGGWQLELRDAKGAFVRVLTPRAMGYRRLLAVDAVRGTAYLSASPEPTEGHLYRVALQGEQWRMQRLTYKAGVHSGHFGHGKAALLYVLTAATMEAGTSYTVRRLDPPLGIRTLKPAYRSIPPLSMPKPAYRSIPPLGVPKPASRPILVQGSPSLKTPMRPTPSQEKSPLQTKKPQRDAFARGEVLAKIADNSEDPKVIPQVRLLKVGEQTLRAAVIFPKGFQTHLRYPTLLYVYAGPGYRMVNAVRGHFLFAQWLADRGFLVVSVDGRGTPGRTRAWERAIQGDFIAKPLEDQITGLREVAKLIPQIDLRRVGVYGWSFGGYFSVMATLRRPDVFHAGVAGAPVTDWMDYDTHYTERFLGLPQQDPQAYARSNAILDAPKLKRPLLLIHGTADDNVFFLHSLKLSHALLLAQKHHDFLPLSNMTHMVRRARPLRALNDRLIRFFQHHLGQPRPR